MSRWLVVELLVDPPEKRPKGLGEAEELMSQVYTFAATSRVSPAPSCSFPVQMKVSKIIGIYGMGGVGKTTLLQTNNHNHGDTTKFDHVIWVVASRECRMEKLQTNIAKRLGLTPEENDSEESLAGKLFDFLKNKNCLLFLDELWAPLDLGKLGDGT
ncbi:hypothetical protein BHM03_00057484 [Ensete ventricosum]|nr:hypothetical protein BHM03_00057484 [Ensete ventricosum]